MTKREDEVEFKKPEVRDKEASEKGFGSNGTTQKSDSQKPIRRINVSYGYHKDGLKKAY